MRNGSPGFMGVVGTIRPRHGGCLRDPGSPPQRKGVQESSGRRRGWLGEEHKRRRSCTEQCPLALVGPLPATFLIVLGNQRPILVEKRARPFHILVPKKETRVNNLQKEHGVSPIVVFGFCNRHFAEPVAGPFVSLISVSRSRARLAQQALVLGVLVQDLVTQR